MSIHDMLAAREIRLTGVRWTAMVGIISHVSNNR